MSSPSWELQDAAFDRLAADATLETLLGAADRILDDAPEKQAYPYIIVGEDSELPNETMGTVGVEQTLVFHIWSQYKGSKQVKQIHARMKALLHRWQPTASGWDTTQMLFEFFEIVRDPDGITRHGISRYRVYASEE